MNKESGINTNFAGPSNAAIRSSDINVTAVAVPGNIVITSSDTKNDSSSAGSCTCTPAKTPKSEKRLKRNPLKQAFRKVWLKDPQFQLWLEETEDPYKAKCAVCFKFFRAGKSHLQQHADTTAHIMNMQRKAGASISVPSNAATTSIDTGFAGPGNAAVSSPDAANDLSTDVSIAGPSSAAAAITKPDTENNSSSNSTFIVPAAMKPKTAKALNSKSRKQAFRQAWLEDPYFKPWLQQADDPYKAKCAVCSIFLRAKKSILYQHITNETHIMIIQQKAGASISVSSNVTSSSSDTANNASSDSTFIIPATQQVWRQSFRQAWQEDPAFKPWLQQTDDPYIAECAVCSIFLRAKKSDLHQHVNNETHIMNIQQKAGASISVPSNVTSSSSDTANDSNSNSTFVVPAAMKPKAAKALNSKSRKQAFRQAWLKDPNFKPWLEETEDPYKAKCTLCCKSIIAAKSHLQQHAITEIHITKIRQKAGASISVPSNAANCSSDAKNDSSADVSIAGPSSAAGIISGGNNDSSSASTFIDPAAKKVITQTFRQVWLEDPLLKSWLQQQADDPHKAKCTVSSKYVKADKSHLQNHANSEAHNMNMVHQKEALTSTVKRTFADNVKVAEMTICIDAIEHDKRQCQVDEVPLTNSASEAASTRTRRNGETPTTTRRIHPILHDHRYAKIPRSMWKKILVQKKQIQAMKRERHVYKQHIFRLKKQVTSLKRIVKELRRTQALPDSGLLSEAIADEK